MAAEATRRRLYFALWPDPAQQAELTEATRKAVADSGGRAVPPANLHITLAFLGFVPEERVPEVRAAAAASVRFASRACVSLSRLEHWKRADALCAVSDEEDRVTAGLATGLKTELVGAGFAVDPKPFRPHVTVARKVRIARGAGERERLREDDLLRLKPLVWTFRSFALVDSRTRPDGAAYTVLDSFQLKG